MNLNKNTLIKNPFKINRNPSYKKDADYAIKICRKFALILGLWPINCHDSALPKIFKLFIRFLYYSTTIFTYLSSILHGIFVLHDLHSRLLISGPIIFWTMLLMKYSLFWSRSDDIEKCMVLIEEDWQEAATLEHRSVMMRSAKFGNYIIIICASFMFSGGFFYHVLIPLTAAPIVTENNITVQPFPTPAFGKFFTSGYSPIYEIVFTIQAFTGIFNDTLNVMTFSLAAVLILHSCGQFDVLIMYLNNLVSDEMENDPLSHNRLVIIVQRHLRVLSFVNHLENLLTEVCLIEVMGSTIIICLLGYYIIVACQEVEVSDILAYVFLIASFIFNVFNYSYLGDLLTRQAVKVGDFVCMIKWYKLPKQTVQELILLMKMSQFPVKITVGKFSALSLNSFSAALKTSAAYFNFVWRMTQ